MATKTPQKQSAAQSQDWAVFGLRLLYVLVLCAVIHINTAPVWQSIPPQELMVAFIVSLLANLVLLVFALIPSIHEQGGWALMVGDWATIGVLTPFVIGDTLLTLALLSAFLLVGLGRLRITQGVVNVIVGLTVFLAVAIYNQGQPLPAVSQLRFYAPSVITIALVAGGLIVMMYYRMRRFEETHAAISTAAKERHRLVKDMEHRTKAITEMAQLLSSSLNYHRVLDAASHTGRLALKDPNHTSKAIVLLFRPEDSQLYAISGLSISRHDKGRVTPGTSGLIHDALTICEPVFGRSVRKDPELRHFTSLRTIRSVVVVPLRAGYDNYGVMIFASDSQNAFSENYRSFLEAIGIQTTIALQNASLYQNLLSEKERLVGVEKEARKRLARDLHDGPTQTISAIAMRMGIIRMMLERTPDEVPGEIKKIEQLAYQTTSEIRLMLFALRPLALEEEGGLLGALEQLADKYEAVYEQRVDVIVSDRSEKILTRAQSETMFSIAQEAVNNARKHAQAALITVRVTTFEDTIMFEIIDNGKGFDVDVEVNAAIDRNSLGMRNLYELAELVDGTMTIESTIGEGTTITILIPIDHGRVNEQQDRIVSRGDRFTLSTMR